MARRKGPGDSDVETLEAPPEGLPPDVTEEEPVESATRSTSGRCTRSRSRSS